MIIRLSLRKLLLRKNKEINHNARAPTYKCKKNIKINKYEAMKAEKGKKIKKLKIKSVKALP